MKRWMLRMAIVAGASALLGTPLTLKAQGRTRPPGTPADGYAVPRDTCWPEYNQGFSRLTEAYRLRAITYEQFNEGLGRITAQRDACLAE